MAGNFKWTKEDCEIVYCLAFLGVSTVDERRQRFSSIRGVSLAAINGKMVNYKKLLSGEEAPKKDTQYFQEVFHRYDEAKCNQILADFFYKNMGIVREVQTATSRTSKKSLESLKSDEVSDFFDMAFDHFKESRYEECLDILLGHVNEDNANPDVWNLFGMVCGTLGDHQKAYTHFKRGFLLDSNHKPCFFNYLSSCIAMSYCEEFFTTVLQVIDLLSEDEKKVIVDNFYEGVRNGAIHLMEVPKEFYPFALYGHDPFEVIYHLREGLLPLSIKVIPHLAATTLPIDIGVVAQWMMSSAILYDIKVDQMGSDKAREMLRNASYHSGLFDGGSEEMADYFKSEKPIVFNCYLHDLYLEKVKLLSAYDAAQANLKGK